MRIRDYGIRDRRSRTQIPSWLQMMSVFVSFFSFSCVARCSASKIAKNCNARQFDAPATFIPPRGIVCSLKINNIIAAWVPWERSTLTWPRSRRRRSQVKKRCVIVRSSRQRWRRRLLMTISVFMYSSRHPIFALLHQKKRSLFQV